MVEHKIIVDTSVLVAVSLNLVCPEIGNIQIEDNFYKISKPLFDYFKDCLEKGVELGIVTSEIEIAARSQINNAFLKKISQKLKIKYSIQNLNNYSYSLIKINDALNQNLNLLTRIPINEKEIKKIVNTRVIKFYQNITRHLDNINPVKTIKKRIRSSYFKTFEKKFAEEDERSNLRIFSKLRDKLKQNPPRSNDYRILAQAIYIKEKDRTGNLYVFITSADYHFSKIRIEDGTLNDFIPSEIEKRFHIKCDWPDEILNILINNNH